jgi:hypothetical protein
VLSTSHPVICSLPLSQGNFALTEKTSVQHDVSEEKEVKSESKKSADKSSGALRSDRVGCLDPTLSCCAFFFCVPPPRLFA